MKTHLETITPEKARKYLEKNDGNRVVRQAWVSALAGMIVRGQWATTHQGIAFTADGRLIDGQHRLLAVIEADKPIDVLVTNGLHEEDYVHIDGGRPRITADRLKLVEDQGLNTVVVGIVRAYVTRAKSRKMPTVDEIENSFLGMADAFCEVAEGFKKRIRGVTTGDVGAALACYIGKHSTKGREFFSQFISGAQIESSSPVYLLREALISQRLRGVGHETYWKTIAATKAHHEGRQIRVLQAATSDWHGNKYVSLFWERKRMAERGLETKLEAGLDLSEQSRRAAETRRAKGEDISETNRRVIEMRRQRGDDLSAAGRRAVAAREEKRRTSGS